PGVLERGVDWLKSYRAEQVRRLANAPRKAEPFKEQADDIDALVDMVLAEAGEKASPMVAYLDRDRTHLSVYAKALLGLDLEARGEGEKLKAVLENLSQYVVQDDENQTAYLRFPNDNRWWSWSGNETEAEAFYL